MRVLLAGDTHGNINHLRYLFGIAKQENAAHMIVLGDFGYWAHTEQGRTFLRQVANLIDTLGIPLWWLDGNHENFDALLALPLNDNGVRPILPGRSWKTEFPCCPFAHLPRGYIWEWDNLRFCAFGGAYSIDKDWRVQQEAIKGTGRTLWWPQETISESDLIRFEAGQPTHVDIFLSHDAPAGTEIPSIASSPLVFPEAEANRKALAVAVDMVQPKRLIHGHYHDLYLGSYEGPGFVTNIVGLDCDGSRTASWLVLDTEVFRKRYGAHHHK